MNPQPPRSDQERDSQNVRAHNRNRSEGPGQLRAAIIGVVALAIGLVAGIYFGASAACGTQCSFDVQVFEAYGTWAGALATIYVAAIAGVIARVQHVDQAIILRL